VRFFQSFFRLLPFLLILRFLPLPVLLILTFLPLPFLLLLFIKIHSEIPPHSYIPKLVIMLNSDA